MKKLFLSLALFMSSIVALSAASLDDVRYTEKDVQNFNQVMELLASDKNLPMDQTVIKVAKHFLETPYVAGTLEIEPEKLTVNTRETDCILFVEMCLAMSLTSKEDNPSFQRYTEILRSLRYRDGKVDGYASRIHYTSEWIHQGEKAGIFYDLAKEIGGKKLNQKFFFMTTHTDSYKQLKNDPEAVAKIKEVEESLNKYEYFYIAKEDLEKCTKLLKNGDIVGFNSAVPGLDIAHVSYAYWEGDTLTFIHASYTDKKVVINKKPLVEYTKGIKSHNGLRVVRLR